MSAPTEHSRTSPGPVSGPPIGLLVTEPVRGLAGFAAVPLAAAWLSRAPRGDGHGVLTLPGSLAFGVSRMSAPRRFARAAGPSRGRRAPGLATKGDRPSGLAPRKTPVRRREPWPEHRWGRPVLAGRVEPGLDGC